MVNAKQETIATSMLVTELATKYNEVPKKMLKNILDSFLASIETHVAAGKKIRIDKVGIISVKEAAARKGRNPQTGQEIMIPARKKISFRTASTLKEAVGLKTKNPPKKKK